MINYYTNVPRPQCIPSYLYRSPCYRINPHTQRCYGWGATPILTSGQAVQYLIHSVSYNHMLAPNNAMMGDNGQA